MPEERPNGLVDETSPYLLQHAYNPVQWFSWGTEALDLSRSSDRPILLSVGYSACHWCHVMERESFEDETIAELMNELFVNIKVDREERPDLDEIYMGAVQAMTGSGGWPMTVFLTPDLRPFYGGTYFPPEDRHGRPGFPTVLGAVAQHYRDQREKVDEQADRLKTLLTQNASLASAPSNLDDASSWWDAAFGQLSEAFDAEHGGFGGAPKFPGSMNLAFLLRYSRRENDAESLRMVELTLRKMARGGMYDQIGGGFHRYSVDERWLVPHFEKMLYDNALLTWVYLEALQMTGDMLYGTVASQTLDYVLREMTRVGGGYYATQDADSEGEEGKFFVWSPEEIERALGEDAALFSRYFGVTQEGNFEGGSSILHVAEELPELARSLGVDETEFERVVESGKVKLFAARQGRVSPARDDKIIVAWNGLMMSAMAQGFNVLGEAAYLNSAREAASFILSELVVEGELMHTWKDGRARFRAFQDDYACLVNGLLDLYEASFEVKWLEAARGLADAMCSRFWDAEHGGFFYTEEGEQDLIVRTKNPFDNATPSGNSIAALALLRLAAFLGDSSYSERAVSTLQMLNELVKRSPTACPQMMCALDFLQQHPREVAIVGFPRDRAPFVDAVHARFLPNKVVIAWAPDDETTVGDLIPLLVGKMRSDGGARAYVCANSVCLSPASNVDELVEQLATASPSLQ